MTRWIGQCFAVDGWIGFVIVHATEIDRQLRRLARARVVAHSDIIPQPLGCKADACCSKLAKPMPQTGQAMLSLAIQRDNAVGSILETTFDKIGQHSVRAYFHKGAHASGIHGLNLLDEAYGFSDLAGQCLSDSVRHIGIGRSQTICIHRHERFMHCNMI